MSEYLLLLVLLLFGVAVEAYLKRTPKRLYIFTMFVMGLMFIFRYGQGTDYFAYKWIFSYIPENASFSQLRSLNINSEIGWRLLCQGAKKIGMSFEMLVVLVSMVEWIGFSRFIRLYCPRKMLALLMAYHTFYLTYMFSALRQGLVLCLFIGFLLPWFMKKQYAKFVLGCVVCSAFHSVALVGLLLFLVRLKMFESPQKMILSVVACFAVGIALSTGIFNGILRVVLPDRVLSHYFKKISISIALVERFVMYAIVMYLYMHYSKHVAYKGLEMSETMCFFMRVYTLSVMAYALLMWSPLLASRATYTFKIAEVILVSKLATKRIRFKKLIPIFVAVVSLVMYAKNIDTYLIQGWYYNDVNVLNYPYFSLLEKDEISNYREIVYTFSD